MLPHFNTILLRRLCVKESLYEFHIHKDPKFPIIFHLDTVQFCGARAVMHWHESMEILYFIRGQGIVTLDLERIEAKEGDVAVINSSRLHEIRAKTPSAQYFCLIPDKSFCEEMGIFIDEQMLKNKIQDPAMRSCFYSIAEEYERKAPYYKAAIKVKVGELLVNLFRRYVASEEMLTKSAENRRKLQMVKEATAYIRGHFTDSLTIEEICERVGFSKYYFCRAFKEVTGRTAVDYINYLRCCNARKLLTSGCYNVSESAEESGFGNLSYFSKVYKKYMGLLPSQEKLDQ